MSDIVESVLQAQAEKEAKLKSTEVKRDIDVEIDEGNLLSSDVNAIDIKKTR